MTTSIIQQIAEFRALHRQEISDELWAQIEPVIIKAISQSPFGFTLSYCPTTRLSERYKFRRIGKIPSNVGIFTYPQDTGNILIEVVGEVIDDITVTKHTKHKVLTVNDLVIVHTEFPDLHKESFTIENSVGKTVVAIPEMEEMITATVRYLVDCQKKSKTLSRSRGQAGYRAFISPETINDLRKIIRWYDDTTENSPTDTQQTPKESNHGS